MNNDVIAVKNEGKKEKASKIKDILVIILAIVLAFGCLFIRGKIKEKNRQLRSGIAYYLDDTPVPNNYSTPSYFFPYNDEIYFLGYKDKKYNLTAMNFDGSNIHIVAENDELKGVSFYMVYDGEAYFYDNESGFTTDEKNGKYNKKINLKTGEITELGHTYIFLPETLNDGKIIAVGVRSSASSDKSIREIDLKTNEVIKEIEKKDINSGSIYYNVDEQIKYSIVSLTRGSEAFFAVYKDDLMQIEVHPNLPHEKNSNDSYKLIYAKNDIYYLSYRDKLLKYNFTNNVIEDIVDNPLLTYSIQNTADFNNVYVYSNYAIHRFNPDSLTFDKVFDIYSDFHFSDMVDFNNYTFGGEFFVRDDKYYVCMLCSTLVPRTFERLGALQIYDKTTNETKLYQDLRKTFFDYENKVIYFFVQDGNKYRVEKVDM